MSAIPAGYAGTLRSLHGVAELLLAGPQYRRSGTIRLAPARGGFATVAAPEVAVAGGALVVDGVIVGEIDGATCAGLAAAAGVVLGHSAQADAVSGPAGTELATGAMAGTAGSDLAAGAELEGAIRANLAAAAVGFVAGAPEGLYRDGSGVGVDEALVCDPAAATLIEEAFTLGAQALAEAFAGPAAGSARARAGTELPVLWPEHFDLSIALSETNFGVSPGDAAIPEPYAYVGPWTPRTGDFWNRSFGAARTLAELGNETAVAAFFAEGFRLVTE